MTRGRVRNGIDLDALETLGHGSNGAPELSVRTEWIGGAQVEATISRAADRAASGRTFVVHVDESPSCSGNGTGPAPAELAAVALSAAFTQAFVFDASRDNVVIDALAVRIHERPAGTAHATPRRWHIECIVESQVSIGQLRAYARAAAGSERVRSLALRAPSVRVLGKEREMT